MIRRVEGEEILTTAAPLQAYAFGDSPVPPAAVEEMRADLPYGSAKTQLVAFDGDEAQAVVVGIPMRQNVRGRVLPMLGVSGVASHPAARRKGLVRSLLTRLHEEFRDAGHPVSTLYPFRPSFYERFGYAGFPMPRTVRLYPDGLDRLARVDVPGEVGFHRIADVFDEFVSFLERFLAARHGFAVFPANTKPRDENKDWVALARQGDELTGLMLYRTRGLGHELQARSFLTLGPNARTLLLQWLARHADQFSAFDLPLPPDERPDLWYTDVRYHDQSRVEAPLHSAPMGRILSVEGLSGIGAGSERVTVEVVDDPFIGGIWELDGTGGTLEVRAGRSPEATLTAHGLAGLVYGSLTPHELALRGYGSVDAAVAERLARLFPAASPYLFAQF